MSLISDTDFIIHSLRLSYLRDIDDPYGARIISLDQSYTHNPYIIAASLADEEKWPELTMPSSPNLSDDEGERPSGFPPARLKYTQTIMGRKSGGLGLRVNGKRESTSKRMSGVPTPDDVKNFFPKGALVEDAFGPAVVSGSTLTEKAGEKWGSMVEKTEQPLSSSQPKIEVHEPTVVEDPPVAKVVQFIPTFKGAAEMARRRQIRLNNRRGPTITTTSSRPLSFDSSSEDEIILNLEESDSDFGDAEPPNDSLSEDDEFDPDFAAIRTTGMSSESASDMASSMPSIGASSIPLSSSHKPRLSPVSESHNISWSTEDKDDAGDDSDGPIFEMVTPAPPAKQPPTDKYYPPRRLSGAMPPKPHHIHRQASAPALSSEIYFAKKTIPPIKPVKSALSAMLVAEGPTNPFSETYASISGRGEKASIDVLVFFPHATNRASNPMNLNVRKDATVEEVIGFSLWNYWEEGWLPKLDVGLGDDDDAMRAIKLSAIGWVMLLAEDDGEVDDDFPAPNRQAMVSKLNADAIAILVATPAQIQQNQAEDVKIQRTPSRAAKKTEKLTTGALGAGSSMINAPMPGSAIFNSSLGSFPLSTSLGPSSSHGPQIFLRIRIAESADDIHVSTTIPVSSGTYMQEALELVCRKRKLAAVEYALLLADSNKTLLVPLDRTVASLQGKRDLILVKRGMIEHDVLKAGRTTDPNASIFEPKRMSANESKFPSGMDYTASYKKYTVYRKLSMLVSRQEKTLAIDGIMPSTKARAAVFDGKTLSFHVRSIADCEAKGAMFKIIFNRSHGHGHKRLMFEAENSKLAAEIVTTIKSVKTVLDRSGTLNRSRRSKHA